MSAENSKRDFVMRWLRQGFWIVFAYALTFAFMAVIFIFIAAIFIVPACLMGFLFGLLCWRWPFLSGISTDWVVLVSLVISEVLVGVYIYMDTRKWHIGERLQRLREGKGRDKRSQ